MKLDYQDRIDDYLLNRMSDEECQSFEKEVEENAELREQLEYTRKVREAITSRNEMLTAMREWEDDYHWKKEGAAVANSAMPANKIDRPVNRRLVYWISGIAAVFVAGLFILFRPGSPSVVNPSSDVVLGGTFKGDGWDYSDIEDMLQQKKYDEALSVIELERDSVRMDSVGIVTDRTIDEEDLEYGMTVIKERQSELKWLKAQALIGLDRKDEALILLDELRKVESDYQQWADSLYNQINQ